MSDKVFIIDLGTQVTNEDRYAFNRFMGYKTPQKDTDSLQDAPIYDPTDSYFMQQIMLLPKKGEFVVTAQVQESRPDNCSLAVYSTNSMWHILLWYNCIRLYCDIKIGMVLAYPDLAQVESLYFSLKAKQVSRDRI